MLFEMSPGQHRSLRSPRPLPVASGQSRFGFTLIELLVVIGIIAILVGILLPVMSTVRQKGFETSTRAELGRIATGINAYYNDFHAYPGPVAEGDIDAGTCSSVQNLKITSSENLTLALVGGLQNMTGMIKFNPALVTTGPQSLNALNAKTYNSYMDVTTDELSPKDPANPANYLAFGTSDSVIPEFLDHIPGNIIGSTNANFQTGPILYLRCRVGATGGNNSILAEDTQGAIKAPYLLKQLYPYSVTKTSVNTTDFPAGSYADSWTDYFANPALQNQPRSKDSFILISAGTDRKYGTKDDIIYGN